MHFPVESAENRPSDHGIVSYEAMLDRPADFAWETHEYLKMSQEGIDRFCTLIRSQDWSSVTNTVNIDEKTKNFHDILDTHLKTCFIWKRVRRKSNSSPWLTDGLRKQMKKRICIFRSEGKSNRWKRIDESIKRTLEIRKGKYFENESERIKAAGNSSKWYPILPKLNETQAKQWAVNEIEPETKVEELAENLAAHFTSITNETGPIRTADIPTSLVPPVLIPQLLERNVAERIRKYKKTQQFRSWGYPKGINK